MHNRAIKLVCKILCDDDAGRSRLILKRQVAGAQFVEFEREITVATPTQTYRRGRILGLFLHPL
jgi:hypothetical protein